MTPASGRRGRSSQPLSLKARAVALLAQREHSAMELRRKLLRDAWRLRGQVSTIALVIACGIAAFTGALSAHDSLLRLRERDYEEGRFAQVFAPLRHQEHKTWFAGSRADR